MVPQVSVTSVSEVTSVTFGKKVKGKLGNFMTFSIEVYNAM